MNTRSLIAIALLWVVGCSPSAPATAPSNASAGAPHDTHAAAGRTTLLGNLGAYSRPITASSEAQSFFDEGLTLLYGFNHEEAFRSFERAAALDANAAMPHWGMSLALGTNYNDTATPDRVKQAYVHLTHAKQLASRGTPVERALIDALAQRYVATPDDGCRRSARRRTPPRWAWSPDSSPTTSTSRRCTPRA
jgi:hypothetical protein